MENETDNADMMTDSEMLNKILEENKKRTLFSKITAVCSAGILTAFVIFGIATLPKIYGMIDNANDTMLIAESALQEAETAAAGIAQMSTNISLASENVNDFITENAVVFSNAAVQIDSIDYESLNAAINGLHDAVAPFAKFVNMFK